MIIGHQKIIDYLSQGIKNNHLAHAYLFAGPAHLGKKTVAMEFIGRLTGADLNQKAQPDILLIEPETVEKEGVKKEAAITISQIKKVRHQMGLCPYQSPYKIALIDQAEKMTPEAGNCLLKTLEEPSGEAIIILISARPQQLLPTVISRCQLLKFLPVPHREIKKAIQNFEISNELKSNLDKIIQLANGRPGIALEYLENPVLFGEYQKTINQLKRILSSDLNTRYQYVEEINRDAAGAQRILSQWLLWFRDALLNKLNCREIAVNQIELKYQNFYSLKQLKEIISKIEKTYYIIRNPSFNSRLALEVLMLEF